MKIYHDEIMRLAKCRDSSGRLDDGSHACLQNPLCGDECTLYVRLRDGLITAARHETRGCILCQAAVVRLIQLSRQTPSLAAMAELARAFDTALREGSALPPMLELFTPVAARRSRHRCVLLPYQALLQIAESSAERFLEPRA